VNLKDLELKYEKLYVARGKQQSNEKEEEVKNKLAIKQSSEGRAEVRKEDKGEYPAARYRFTNL
jgi:hypothetical protein